MTRQQFIARQREAAQAGTRVDVPGMAILVGGLLLFVPTVRYLCACYPPGRVLCGAVLAAAAHVAINYVLAMWVLIRRARAYGLTCPICGRSLLGARGNYVVATGRCAECDTVIVSTAQPAVA